MARATVVLPQPDSPTRPTHSPCCTCREQSTTAGTSPARVLYETCKPSMASRGGSSMRAIVLSPAYPFRLRTAPGLSYPRVSALICGLAFPSFIELHQDTVGVTEEDGPDVPLGVTKCVGWSAGLGSVGEQAVGHFLDIGDRKRYVANADLVEHNWRATDRLARVLGQDQEPHRLRVPIAQVDHAAPGVASGIEVRQAPAAGVLHLVLGHLKAQGIAIEL